MLKKFNRLVILSMILVISSCSFAFATEDTNSVRTNQSIVISESNTDSTVLRVMPIQKTLRKTYPSKSPAVIPFGAAVFEIAITATYDGENGNIISVDDDNIYYNSGYLMENYNIKITNKQLNTPSKGYVRITLNGYVDYRNGAVTARDNIINQTLDYKFV